MAVTSGRRTVRVFKSADELALHAANLIISAGRSAVEERGCFTLVLAGGSTPERTYRALAQRDQAAAVDWSRTQVFFGDERFVPRDDSRSNYRMAAAALLEPLDVPEANVLAIPTDRGTAAECASEYERMLRGYFGSPTPSADEGVQLALSASEGVQLALSASEGVSSSVPAPRFDLVLLGTGEDGHTASLFPGAAALDVDDAWVTWSPPGTLPPAVDRITMTYPALNAARQILFLVTGEGKARVLRDVLEGGADRRQRPAAGIYPVDGWVMWLVDEAAARLLT